MGGTYLLSAATRSSISLRSISSSSERLFWNACISANTRAFCFTNCSLSICREEKWISTCMAICWHYIGQLICFRGVEGVVNAPTLTLLVLHILSHMYSSTPSGQLEILSRSARATSRAWCAIWFCLAVDGRSENGLPELGSYTGVSEPRTF